MLLTERYADDGDIEQHTEKDMREPYPNTTEEKPQHIHKEVQTTVTILFIHNDRTERPQREYTQFDSLKAERYTDNRYHQGQACQKIFDGSFNATEY